MRKLLPLILVFYVGLTHVAFGQLRIVDLNAPGALDALARDNPRHYERIREILSEAQKQPESEVPRWMQARFDARDVVYGPLLLVTEPPKRHLSFTIDKVQYRSIITLTNLKPQRTPAK